MPRARRADAHRTDAHRAGPSRRSTALTNLLLLLGSALAGAGVIGVFLSPALAGRTRPFALLALGASILVVVASPAPLTTAIAVAATLAPLLATARWLGHRLVRERVADHLDEAPR